MNVTQLASPRPARAACATSARPVTELLLELAYHLHATHVVAVLPAKLERRPVRRREVASRTAGRSA